MRNAILLLALSLVGSVATADQVIVTRRAVIVTAQDQAEALAARGAFNHSGCNQTEGIGMGSTPQKARQNCCFFGRRAIVDEGVAWSPLRRRWIAVIRYQ